jgi:hypothetical protein
MTPPTTQTVQLESGITAIIGEGYRPKCDHDSCHEQAIYGYRDGTECPTEITYVHLMAGSSTNDGGVYLDGAFLTTMTADAADALIKALTERVRLVREMEAALGRAGHGDRS